VGIRLVRLSKTDVTKIASAIGTAIQEAILFSGIVAPLPTANIIDTGHVTAKNMATNVTTVWLALNLGPDGPT
jgi:hypothetical protein